MSKVSHLPKSVPAKTLAFKFKEKGNATKKFYEGDFAVTVPTMRQMSQIGVEIARLGDGVPFEFLDENTAKINNALAFLRTCVVESPEWFHNQPTDIVPGMNFGLDSEDLNIVIKLFQKASERVEQWQAELSGQPEESSATV